jgi:hypothetical protein
METLKPHRSKLRRRILHSLQGQGFEMRSGLLVAPDVADKESVRELHRESVRHNIERARAGLARHEQRLNAYIAHGSEVIPENISPRFVEVEAGTEDELLFRYVRLHWSIPVSAGYGRRIRFLVYDDSNGKLIGLFGLADPIFSLGPRDLWIGWTGEQRRQRLQCVMDLFVLGAVPPYSQLLCGKLIALLATSSEVQQAFRRKYGIRKSRIRRHILDKRLALLTTTSALGRSSLYNRLRYRDDRAFISVGFTRGSGEFQFVNGYYHELRELALANCDPTAKHSRWGIGFRNRREVIRKALPLLGLSPELVYHGIQREIMLAPLAANTAEFLRGEHQRLRSHHRSASDLFAWFRERWLLPRAAWDRRYQDFDAESYKLWQTS